MQYLIDKVSSMQSPARAVPKQKYVETSLRRDKVSRVSSLLKWKKRRLPKKKKWHTSLSETDFNKLERFVYSGRFLPTIVFIVCIATLLHLIMARLVRMVETVVKYYFYANVFAMGWDWSSKWNWIVFHVVGKLF
ncbi:unnamed protein product [Kluyveromyces dobzhanskii CBS 2104]|uniref:WGS project CCBQ000000000 data, contig 00015 n=1 Tax=Kluyveromyces dobzhanskii CBS 2104 TaxID=1427455 RepID=A0A0A8L8V7_9SACH|nr:unnamed protein product [Kluyveromyces dobzhanskii CBS 2104]